MGAREEDEFNKGLQNLSMAETSAGPEWLQEPSLELPSSGPSVDLLTAGASVMTEGSDALELQHSHDSVCLGHHHHSHDTACCGHHHISLEGIKEGHSAFVSQRTPLIAVLELPRSTAGENSDQTPPIQKRILKVAPTVPHVCLAFDPFEIEREREHLSTQVTALLHPKTRRLVDDIQGAGKFPKKKVLRGGKLPPVRHSYPSGSMSARDITPVPDNTSTQEDEYLVERKAVVPPTYRVDSTATAQGSPWLLLNNNQHR